MAGKAKAKTNNKTDASKKAMTKASATKAAVKTPIKLEPKKPVKVAKALTKKAAGVKEGRNSRKVYIGKVTSNKMDKTIVVAIVNRVPHPLYKKVVAKTTKFKTHDEQNECSIGDTVEIAETRPLSATKYFRLVRIIEKVK